MARIAPLARLRALKGAAALLLVSAVGIGAWQVGAQPGAQQAAPLRWADGAAQSARDAARRFGVIDSGDHPADAAALGVGWEQVTFSWAAFQPGGPDDFAVDAVDPDVLKAAIQAGHEVVGLIVDTPAWASESGLPGAVPRGLDRPVDDPANVWAAFVSRLAAHYAPLGIHQWIVYSEPDIRPGEGRVQFAGTVEDYARLLTVAYRAARAADPAAAIHVAGMNWWADVAAGREPYLARLLRVLEADLDAAANGYYFDAVTLRVFDTTQAVWDVVTATRAILDQAGLPDKAIWLETNASPTLDPRGGQPKPVFGITPDMQADFIVQAAALGLAAGADALGIYRLADDPAESQPWGLIRADGSRRPAFDAYRAVIALFGPTQTAQRYSRPEAELIVLQQADRDIYVMWARGTTPVQFQVTSAQVGEVATMYRPGGSPAPVQSGPDDWPAAFVLDGPAASRDANGFLTVAGSPRVLVLDRAGGFFRVVYGVVNGQRFRLK
jgi:hypothetical protein